MEYAGLELSEADGRFYFEDSNLAATHDAKGMVRRKLDQFIVRHQLKESNSRIYPQWGMLVPLDRRNSVRQKYTNHFRPIGDFVIMDSVDDHTALFQRNKQYVYCTQPYGLKVATYIEVEELWRSLGLYVNISYKDAWWYPGRTPLITISQMPIELTK